MGREGETRGELNTTFFQLLIFFISWVNKVAAAGGNYFRIWIGATGFGFEIEATLGNYDSTQNKGTYETNSYINQKLLIKKSKIKNQKFKKSKIK